MKEKQTKGIEIVLVAFLIFCILLAAVFLLV